MALGAARCGPLTKLLQAVPGAERVEEVWRAAQLLRGRSPVRQEPIMDELLSGRRELLITPLLAALPLALASEPA